MPPYQRCGDIVWQCKRHTRSYAFKCLFCEHISAAFRDFKLHLEAEHVQQLDEIKVEEDLEEAPPLSNIYEQPEQPKMEPSEEELELDPLDKQEDEAEVESPAEDELFELPSNDSVSSDELDVDEEPPTDTKHFWLRQHPIMLSLLQQIEEQPLLWDISTGAYRNHKRRQQACDQIAQQLNEEFQLKLSGQEIANYNKKLRAVYCREQRRLTMLQVERKAPYQPQWYFQRLSFLRDCVSFRPRGRRGSKALASGNSALPVPQLSHEQNLRLIEIYRRCRRSWDMQDMSCRLRNVRQKANEELLRLCRQELKLEADLQQEQLQQFVYRIRYAYTQQRTRQLQSERQGGKFAPSCRYFKQIQFLEQHVPPFKCEICDELMNGVDRFMAHRAQHDGSLPFICPLCQRGFSRSGNCTMHLRRHTQDYQVACEDCGKRFASTSDMQVHRRYHTGEKPYCCDVCGQRFRTSSFFDRHKRRHEQRPKAKCHLCGKSFFEQSVLNDHIKAHLNVRDKVCDVCQKTFTSAKYLRQHKEIHAAQKRYCCKICAKGFAQYAGLSGHMKSHGTTVRGAAKVASVATETETETKANAHRDNELVESTTISIELAPLRA